MSSAFHTDRCRSSSSPFLFLFFFFAHLMDLWREDREEGRRRRRRENGTGYAAHAQAGPDWLHYIYLWIRLLSWLGILPPIERWKSIVIFEFDELISDCVDFDNNQGSCSLSVSFGLSLSCKAVIRSTLACLSPSLSLSLFFDRN